MKHLHPNLIQHHVQVGDMVLSNSRGVLTIDEILPADFGIVINVEGIKFTVLWNILSDTRSSYEITYHLNDHFSRAIIDNYKQYHRKLRGIP